MEISKWISRIFLWIFSILIFTSNETQSHFSHYEDEGVPISLRLTEESCTFPARWEGTWFQSGVHLSISVNRTAISSKGRCVEADGDKFIVYNPSDSCYRCVVFHEKHSNVLQYKETFCNVDPDGLSLQRICRMIPGDAHLYSMFRLEAEPIPCPFQGPFTFSYSRGQGRVCQAPVSTMDTCIHSSRLVLNYQACHDVPGTESSVEELQCLALWKEGSSRYLVGLVQYGHPASLEDRFRCFAYEKGNRFGSSDGMSVIGGRSNQSTSELDRVIFRVAQSGDATCLGLTPYEGSKTLTLHRGATLSKPCQFPAWLRAHAQWFTLDGSTAYAFEASTLRIMETSEASNRNLLSNSVCAQIKENQSEKLAIVVRSTTECQIGYTCFIIHRRDGHVIEIQMGKLSRDIENACHHSYLDEDSTPFITLTSPTPETRQCPYEGQFAITSIFTGQPPNSQNCDSSPKIMNSLLMGCGSLDSIHLSAQCSAAQRLSEEYSCNAWWEDGEDSYLVVTSMSDKNPRFCFRIREIVLELTPQELRKKELSFRDIYENSMEDESREFNSRKIFQFSISAESCGRSSEGTIYSFNATNYDNCNGVSSGLSSILPQTYHVILLILVLTGLWLD